MQQKQRRRPDKDQFWQHIIDKEDKYLVHPLSWQKGVNVYAKDTVNKLHFHHIIHDKYEKK